jgi:hypothetical protein
VAGPFGGFGGILDLTIGTIAKVAEEVIDVATEIREAVLTGNFVTAMQFLETYRRRSHELVAVMEASMIGKRYQKDGTSREKR